jgi:hypothetical protein
MTHTPNDCALLITIPLTEEDFLSDYNENSEKDFIKGWAKNQIGELKEEELWEIYVSRIRDFVVKIADEIRSLGVEVVFNAGLGDLTTIFLKKKVITLAAHWFSPKLAVTDFYDLNRFVEKLFESEELYAKVLRQVVFSGNRQSPVILRSESDDGDSLVNAINQLFSRYNTKGNIPKPVEINSADGRVTEEVWIHLNRFALEKTFPDEIKPRCRIEMFDGLYSPSEFQNKIPSHFDGVLDLTVCNSEMVGKTIKQTCPQCLVLTNRFTTELKTRLILYRGIIRLLSNENLPNHNRNPPNYIDATFNLRRQLLEQNGEEQ